MKYLLIISVFILSCSGDERGDIETKKVYEDCFKVSSNMFKSIPESEYKSLSVDQLCDEDTSFYNKTLDKVCLKACQEAFYIYKNRDKT